VIAQANHPDPLSCVATKDVRSSARTSNVCFDCKTTREI
jgi:hypothetical protein